MTTWVPDLARDEPKDGDRVRIGDGPHEGKWKAFASTARFLGWVQLDDGFQIDVPVGCPVTVLREVEREWQPGPLEAAMIRHFHGSAQSPYTTPGHAEAPLDCWHCEEAAQVAAAHLVPATPDADQ